VGDGGLTLNWINSSQIPEGTAVAMLLQVLDEGMPVSGANVSISQISYCGSSVHARAITDGAGNATLNFSLTPQMLEDSAVMARALHGEKSATRKFRFNK
jgi:hypothetical protein